MGRMKGKITAIACGVVVGLVVKLFAIDILCVRGESMSPSLADGQLIVASKLAYGIVNPLTTCVLASWRTPQRGDVVVFARGGEYVVKRCAGVAGDTIELCVDGGTVKVAGVSYPATDQTGELFAGIERVPCGMIVVIGDNTSNSSDSRSWGFLAQRRVFGKVIIR